MKDLQAREFAFRIGILVFFVGDILLLGLELTLPPSRQESHFLDQRLATGSPKVRRLQAEAVFQQGQMQPLLHGKGETRVATAISAGTGSGVPLDRAITIRRRQALEQKAPALPLCGKRWVRCHTETLIGFRQGIQFLMLLYFAKTTGRPGHDLFHVVLKHGCPFKGQRKGVVANEDLLRGDDLDEDKDQELQNVFAQLRHDPPSIAVLLRLKWIRQGRTLRLVLLLNLFQTQR
jgi:hypothetical protein